MYNECGHRRLCKSIDGYMCGFTVVFRRNEERKAVAKDILKARKKDGIILVDAMGNITKAEAANREVVDTLMQWMILKIV